MQGKYGGKPLGRQEINAEIFDDADDAWWTRDLLDATRAPVDPDRAMRRVVVAVDPAGGSNRGNAETGIVVAGIGADGHGYVLADLSGRFKPERWAYTAVAAYRDHRADRIVAERNFGGEMVESTLRGVAPDVPVRMVQASRGKVVRAEPVVALFEQKRAHMVGTLATLEDQLCGWDPIASGPSPDRLDAMVWALSELMLGVVVQPARWINFNYMAR